MYDLNLKVLVVDDMLTMRKLVTKALKEIGFTQFTEAGDGAKAWEAVTAPGASIGLIVSDWNMPNSTGVDLLKRVRAAALLPGHGGIGKVADRRGAQGRCHRLHRQTVRYGDIEKATRGLVGQGGRLISV
jgi:PleD family two-component response regulator